ncbi:MAG TPA: hypothetical protein PLU10_09115 [Chitinophagaceae bacterium]|nr:hypothetical protein [Chitinophagaceae bacterium]
MKQLGVILFIALLFSQSTSRIFVYAQWQLNQSYLAKNVCENRNKKGSCCEARCQLKKNLDKVDNEETNPNSAPKKIKLQEQESFVITDTILFESTKFHFTQKAYLIPNSLKYNFNPSHSIFHPPNSIV